MIFNSLLFYSGLFIFRLLYEHTPGSVASAKIKHQVLN